MSASPQPLLGVKGLGFHTQTGCSLFWLHENLRGAPPIQQCPGSFWVTEGHFICTVLFWLLVTTGPSTLRFCSWLGPVYSVSEIFGVTDGDLLGAVSLLFVRRKTSSFREGSWGPGNPSASHITMLVSLWPNAQCCYGAWSLHLPYGSHS